MKPSSKDTGADRANAEREAKLAQALRANLRRRKAGKATSTASEGVAERDKRS